VFWELQSSYSHVCFFECHYYIRQALDSQTTLLDKVIWPILRWFGHVERMTVGQFHAMHYMQNLKEK